MQQQSAVTKAEETAPIVSVPSYDAEDHTSSALCGPADVTTVPRAAAMMCIVREGW